jgi:hypothetical protein
MVVDRCGVVAGGIYERAARVTSRRARCLQSANEVRTKQAVEVKGE